MGDFVNKLLRRRRSTMALVSALLGGLLLLVAPSSPAALAQYDACGSLIGKTSGEKWSCTFVDNFSGNSLDTGNWTVGETPTTGYAVGATCFDKDNVAVKQGTLRLLAKDEGHTFQCSSPYAPFSTRYTGGHIATTGHFSQAYGRFEVRAKYPASGAGLHSGFWMYPEKLTYGAWPASGEIDVAEWWSNTPTYALPTLHYSGSTAADSGSACKVANPSVFHTYTMEWETAEMRFSIDGKQCFSRSWTPDAPLVAPQPFDKPFVLVLGNAVGPATGTNAVSATTNLPATYTVDYIKAWR